MPWAAAATVAGSVLSSALASGSSPSAGSMGGYQPTGTGQQDQNLQGLLNSNYSNLSGSNNPYSQMSPQMLQAFQSLFSSPGAGGYGVAAGQAGQGYGQIGQQAVQNSSALSGAIPQTIQGANAVFQQGQDPQNALYNQQLQLTNDQANVHNAQYGLTGQQAAGNVNQADTNFNIDWQNQELQRAMQGLSGYDQGVTTAGNTGATAQNLGAAGAGSVLQGGMAPYNAQQAIGGNQETALMQYISQLMGGVNSTQSAIQNEGNYLGQGIGASQNYGNAVEQNYSNNQMAMQNAGQMGGYLGSQLGGIFTPNTTASTNQLPWQMDFGASGFDGGGFTPTSYG